MRWDRSMDAALVAAVLVTGGIREARASWIYGGNQLSFTAGASEFPSACPDGSGGVYVAWETDSAGTPFQHNLRLQRYDALGNALWASGGIVICNAPGDQAGALVAPDDSGGVYVAWTDFRPPLSSAGIYAQRILPSGFAMWATNGVQIAAPRGNQLQRALACTHDRHTGLYLAWVDEESERDTTRRVRAQRVDWSGARQWTASGPVCGVAGNLTTALSIDADDAGLMLAWQESYAVGSGDVRAQRLDLAGAPEWIPDGTVVCNAAGEQSNVAIDGWGALGAIVAWYDLRAPGTPHPYVQRLSLAGLPQWVANGIQIPISGGYYPAVLTDGSYAFVCGSATPLVLERIDSNGALSWGTPKTIYLPGGIAPRLVSDGAGGAMVTWHLVTSGDAEIYVRRMDAAGDPAWNYLLRITNDTVENSFPAVTSDAAGGVYAAWHDVRTGTQQVYLSRVTDYGTVPSLDVLRETAPAIALGAPRPQPSRSDVRLTLRLPSRERVSARIVDVAGRGVRRLGPFELPAGEHELRWNGADDRGGEVQPGLYVLEVRVGSVIATRRIVRLP